MDHDALIREIETTISTKGIGIGQTARALQVSPQKLRSILRSGVVPTELVERAREIGLVPAGDPGSRGGSPKI
jgi:hypothetical protein